MSASPRPLLAGAEPFEIAGREDLGVLLVHGFTGTPFELRPVADALAAEGIGSACPLLRGHGTHPNDMVGWTCRDWLDDVERGLDRLLKRHERAVLVGLSMGGTLALNVASRRADDPRLAGLVTIGAPLVLDDWRLAFASLIVKVVKWQAWGKPDIKDRAAWDRQVSYRRIRTRAILEMLALMADTRFRLERVSPPLLVLQARDDHVVPPRNAELIRDGVGSADRRVILLDNCYHVGTVDFEAARINAEILHFVQRLAYSDGAAVSSIVQEPP
jgi:carboxylesterase